MAHVAAMIWNVDALQGVQRDFYAESIRLRAKSCRAVDLWKTLDEMAEELLESA